MSAKKVPAKKGPRRPARVHVVLGMPVVVEGRQFARMPFGVHPNDVATIEIQVSSPEQLARCVEAVLRALDE